MRNYKKWTFILLAFWLAGGAVAGGIWWNKNRPSSNTKNNPQVSENGEPRLVVQLGHSGGISSAVYSPDGKFIVSGGIDDKVAILWEASTGREIRRFIGHTNQINSVAFSPDSKFVLTGSGQGEFEAEDSKIANDYTARLWDISNNTEVRNFEGHTGAVNSVAFSSDGKFILTGSNDKTARLWDLQTGKEIKRLFNSSSVISVAYSSNNQFVLTGESDCNRFSDKEGTKCLAKLWETSSWNVIHTVEQDYPVLSVSFSSDSKFFLIACGYEFYSASVDGAVSQWDIATRRKIRNYQGSRIAAFSPNSQFVITAKNSGAEVWNALNGEGLFYIEGFSNNTADKEVGFVKTIAVSPNNSSMIIGFGSEVTNALIQFGEEAMYVFSLQPTSKLFNLGGYSRKLDAYGREILSNNTSTIGNSIQIENNIWNKLNGNIISFEGVDSNKTHINPIVLSSDDKIVLMGLYNENPSKPEFGIWELNTGNRIARFENGGYAAWITPNNRFVLFEDFANPEDGFLLSFYEITTGRLKWSYHLDIGTDAGNSRYLSQRRTYSTLSPDGRLVYLLFPNQYPEDMKDAQTGEIIKPPRENELLIIETESGDVVKRIQTSKQDGKQGIYISLNCRFIGFRKYPNGFNVFDTNSGNLLFQIDSNTSWMTGAFSPDSKLLAVTGLNTKENTNPVQIWSLPTGKMIREFPQVKQGFLADLPFSPDSSKLLMTNSGSRNIAQLLDISTGKEIYKFEHSDVITSSAFSADGHSVITSSADGTSRIWSIETGKEICRLSSFQNGDWIVTTPDGRFDTNNLDKVEGMHWILPGEPLRPLPIEIFLRQYYEPKLLARVLKCNENKNCEQEFKALPALNTLNRTQPSVKIADIKPDSDNTVEITVEVANAKSEGQKDTFGNPLESGVNDVRLFRDGQLVAYAPKNAQLEQTAWEWLKSWFVETSKETGKVELDKDGKATLKFSKIKLPRTGVDKLEFSAYAFNVDQIKSETSRQSYAIKPNTVKGRAYIISFGVNATEKANLNLRFAANDARQTQENLTKRLREQGQYEEVVNIPLISDFTISVNGQTIAAKDATIQQIQTGQKTVTENTATKAHFKAVLDVLAGRQVDANLLKTITNTDKLRTANPEDLIIISASSHGFADKDGIFYLVPSDSSTASVDSADFRQKAISSDELSLWLRDVDGGEMALIIDACHSASAVESADFKPAPMNSRGLGQLSYDKGMRILTATQADNVALETNKTRQGLLSYALLQNGLNDFQADFKPQDKTIMMSEWLNFGVQRVPRLYEEAKSGQVKVVRETADTAENEKQREDRTQQPSLFDFSRRRRDVTIDKRSGSVPKQNQISETEKPKVETNNQSIQPVNSPTPNGFNGRVIKHDTVIVRASDSDESAELGRVLRNDPIKIGYLKGKWYRVTTVSGLEGWIHGNSLEFVK